MLTSTRGATQSLRVEVTGLAEDRWAISGSICVAARGALPADGTCRGTLLAQHRVMATAAQRDPRIATFGFPSRCASLETIQAHAAQFGR